MTQKAREFIRDLALKQGFDVVGISRARGDADVRAALFEFLEAERQGDMAWMKARAESRANPQVLWPAARSAIVVGVSYAPAEDPLLALADGAQANISVYAKGADYHDVIKKRLKAVARKMADKYATEVKVFVDTAPVMEKPLAQSAGIGWQGKHTNLVSRTHGSWLFLGVILTSLEIGSDEKGADHCGSCSRCLEICPTNAFPAPYKLDAQRCISYLTIEHKGPIPLEFRSQMGNRIYGCDDCLAVCPWNKFAIASREMAFEPREEFKAPRLFDLCRLTDPEFRALFKASPIKRIGRNRFLRNVLIAIGNSGDAELAKHIHVHLKDEAAIVRGAAIWALRRLLPDSEIAPLRLTFKAQEQDPEVAKEWTAKLTPSL